MPELSLVDVAKFVRSAACVSGAFACKHREMKSSQERAPPSACWMSLQTKLLAAIRNRFMVQYAKQSKHGNNFVPRCRQLPMKRRERSSKSSSAIADDPWEAAS